MSFDVAITWALQTGLSVTILIGLVLILRRPFARWFGAKTAYALWALPLLRLVTPPIELPWLRPLAEPQIDQLTLTPELLAALQQAGLAQSEAGLSGVNWNLMIALFWAVGAIVFALWQLNLQRRAAANWLQNAQPATEGLVSRGRVIAAELKLRRVPQVLLSKAAAGPLVINALRPKIILPVNFETTFTAQEQSHALRHELSHIRRGDLYASLAALVVRIVNWPNPLVHIAARYFRADQEAACDASVLAYIDAGMNSPHETTRPSLSYEYAQTLMKAALHAQNHEAQISGAINPRAPALALTIHHPLKERLMSLSNPAPNQTLKHRLAAATIAAALLGLTAPISLVAAEQPDQQSTDLAGGPQTPTPPQTPSTGDRSQPIIYGGKTQKHVVHSKALNNGAVQERKVEISVDGDNVRAFEIDPVSGVKTEINPETIEGYENITKGPGTFKIDAQNGNVIRFAQGDEAAAEAVIEKLKAEGKLDDKTISRVIKVIKSTDDKDGNVWVSENGDNVKVISKSFAFIEGDDSLPEGFNLEDFEGEINFKVLNDLSGTVDFITDDDVSVVFADGDFPKLETSSRLQAVETMLESAEKMLGQTSETNRSLKKAQKELGEAMKALEKARAELDAEK